MQKIPLCLCLIVFFVAPVFGASPVVDLSTSYGSRYVHRGVVLSTGPVIQTSLDADINDFGVNVWSNVDHENSVNGKSAALNETDITLRYIYSGETFIGGGGYVYYGNAGSGLIAKDAQEAFLLLGGKWSNRSVRLAYYRDISPQEDGGFIVLSSTVRKSVVEWLHVVGEGYVSYDSKHARLGVGRTGELINDFYAGEIGVAVEWRPSPGNSSLTRRTRIMMSSLP